MIKHTIALVAYAAMLAAPTVVAAQAATSPTTATAAAPGTCDCPIGDPRGELKNLAAFAPLGLLGALAAAGGVPSIFAARTDDAKAAQNVASNNAPTEASKPVTDNENAATERARNSNTDPRNTATDRPLTDAAPSKNRGRVPDPVSPDSLRAGLRAPNTGTALPSVFLLGTGLVAIGCVTVLRTRS